MGTMTPTPKVAAGTTAGAAVLVLVWAAGLAGLEVPELVAGALVLLIGNGAAWLKSERPRGDHAA